MNCRETAQEYRLSGYSVVPLLPGDKRPLVKWEQYQHQAATEEEIDAWWSEFPDANVAIVTGQVSGLTVIDVDGDMGLKSITEMEIRPPTPTRTIKTPNGWHLCYKYHSDYHTGAGFLPGIDVRSDGGYVVAPPSTVDGIEYTLFRDSPPADLSRAPGVFKAKSRDGNKPSAPTQPGELPNWVSAAIRDGAAMSQRNTIATRLAGYLHSKAIPKDIILEMLREFGARCDPPMDEPELERTIQSVTRYQQAATAARVVDPPEFEDRGSSQLYRWPTWGVEVTLSKVTAVKEGVASEITITAQVPGEPPVRSGPDNLNLLATTSKVSLIRSLKTRIDLDWASIIETVAQLAVAQLRQGSPLLDLAEYANRPGEKWLLPPVVLDGQPTILFGDGGTGKSLFALNALVAIQFGQPNALGMSPTAQRKGLYLDWEFDAYEHGDRLAKLLRGLECPDAPVLYLREIGPLVDDVSRLQRIIHDEGIGFLVIDSAAPACGGEGPEKADSALRFFNAIRALKTTCLIVAHQSKDDKTNKPFGSVFFSNMARATWEVKAYQRGEGPLEVSLTNRKSNSGRIHDPLAYIVNFMDDSITLKRTNITETEKLKEEAPVRLRLKALLLREGPMTIDQIVDTLDVPTKTVRSALDRNTLSFIRLTQYDPHQWGVVTAADTLQI